MCLSILGLCLNMFGTFLVGFVSQGVIPKKGEPIKTPKRWVAYLGRTLVLLGFSSAPGIDFSEVNFSIECFSR